MFFNRLMGASETNQGEIITKVKDNLWQSNRGTMYWLVEPDLCQSSTGVYYRRTGLNVFGSDSSWFSSLDVFDQKQKPISTAKQAEHESNVKTGAMGCLTIISWLPSGPPTFVRHLSGSANRAHLVKLPTDCLQAQAQKRQSPVKTGLSH